MKNKNIIAVQNLIKCLEIESLRNPEVVANLVRAFGIVNDGVENFGEDEKFKNESSVMAGMAQTPDQIGKALVYLSDFKIKTYLEIGTFQAGNFLFVSEYLRRFNPEIKCLGIDPIQPPDDEIRAIIETEMFLSFKAVDSDHIADQKFDLVFIDGNHTAEWIKRDFRNIGCYAKICMFHDIQHPSCPDIASFWQTIKNDKAVEFLDSSLSTPFHGIGIMHFPKVIKESKKTFMHSGDIGDIIYSLPTIRALGGGKIFLNPSEPTHKFNEDSARLLIPLLVAQPYIDDVAIYNGEEIDCDLNKFRSCLSLGVTNLTEAHLKAFDLPISLKNKQWLDVGKRKIKRIIFNRSARNRNTDFPWKELAKRFKDQSVFVGLKEEHEEFVESFGHIPFHKVHDFLELAEIINGADLFIGNQSLSFAISEGLHKRNCLEIYEHAPNCNFERKGHNIDGMSYARAK
jgi:hypothetical protein